MWDALMLILYYNNNNNNHNLSKMTNVLGVVVAVAVALEATAAAWLDKHLFNMTIKTSQTAYTHTHTRTQTHGPFGTVSHI